MKSFYYYYYGSPKTGKSGKGSKRYHSYYNDGSPSSIPSSSSSPSTSSSPTSSNAPSSETSISNAPSTHFTNKSKKVKVFKSQKSAKSIDKKMLKSPATAKYAGPKISKKAVIDGEMHNSYSYGSYKMGKSGQRSPKYHFYTSQSPSVSSAPSTINIGAIVQGFINEILSEGVLGEAEIETAIKAARAKKGETLGRKSSKSSPSYKVKVAKVKVVKKAVKKVSKHSS